MQPEEKLFDERRYIASFGHWAKANFLVCSDILFAKTAPLA
jgi:hypothetical protein